MKVALIMLFLATASCVIIKDEFDFNGQSIKDVFVYDKVSRCTKDVFMQFFDKLANLTKEGFINQAKKILLQSEQTSCPNSPVSFIKDKNLEITRNGLEVIAVDIDDAIMPLSKAIEPAQNEIVNNFVMPFVTTKIQTILINELSKIRSNKNVKKNSSKVSDQVPIIEYQDETITEPSDLTDQTEPNNQSDPNEQEETKPKTTSKKKYSLKFKDFYNDPADFIFISIIIFFIILLIIAIFRLRMKLFCIRYNEKRKENKINRHVAKQVALEKALEERKKEKEEKKKKEENIEEIRVVNEMPTIVQAKAPYMVGENPPPYNPSCHSYYPPLTGVYCSCTGQCSQKLHCVCLRELQPCNMRCHGQKPGKCMNFK